MSTNIIQRLLLVLRPDEPEGGIVGQFVTDLYNALYVRLVVDGAGTPLDDDHPLPVSVAAGALELTPAVDQGDPNGGGADAWPTKLQVGAALVDSTHPVPTIARAPLAPAAYAIPAVGVLPGSSDWTATPTITTSGLRVVTWEVTYTGTGAGAQIGYRVRLGHASPPTSVEPVGDSPLVMSGAEASQDVYDRVAARPVSGGATVTFLVTFEVEGIPYVALDLRELVDGGSGPGTATATVAGGY